MWVNFTDIPQLNNITKIRVSQTIEGSKRVELGMRKDKFAVTQQPVYMLRYYQDGKLQFNMETEDPEEVLIKKVVIGDSDQDSIVSNLYIGKSFSLPCCFA